MIKDATISPCGNFRYTLRRIWGDGPRLLVVMLNPSTADSEKDDPTITRLIHRAKEESFEGLIVCNLYAYRSPHPIQLEYRWVKMQDIIGAANDQSIRESASECDEVLVAWGAHKLAAKRDCKVLEIIYARFSGGGNRVWMIEKTKDGFPKHPLHVAYSRRFQPYKGRFSR